MTEEKPILGYDKFLMMALLKEGPLNENKLWDKTIIFLSLIWYQQLPEKDQPLAERLFYKLGQMSSELEDKRVDKETSDVKPEMDKLTGKDWINLNKDSKYELTSEGLSKAKEYKENMNKIAAHVDTELKPSATAINTTYLDAFLALLKLGGGLTSGSVGLISDGTDATMDTVEAILVWLGIKYHREKLSTLLVIFGLFGASIAILYDAVIHLLAAYAGHAEPVTMPFLVIGVEVIAILAAVFLFYYQRFVGKISNSLTLMSQSVDSKNHIYIGTSVIIGAIFALYGITFVDSLIGLVVGAGIFRDAVGLLKEAISAERGDEVDYSKEYSLPMQEYWEEKNKLMAYQNWILHVLSEKELTTRTEIISSLKKAYHPNNYIPVLTELQATCVELYDFDENFEIIIKPLMEHELIFKENGKIILTENGREHLKNFINNFNYYDVHRSDEILLAMTRDEDMSK